MLRLVSLLPSLTEALCALGLVDELVGITHECDYPPAIQTKTVVTTTTLAHDLTSLEIEEQVQRQVQQEASLYGLDFAALQRLQPDIIFTQGLCEVCAVSETLVHALAAKLDPVPKVVAISPTSLAEVLTSIETIGRATGRGLMAQALLQQAQARIESVVMGARDLARPRVFGLEWLDPPYASGHWFPELVTKAGGTPWGVAGQPSQRAHWDEIAEFAPEVLVILPCGFSMERTWSEVAILRSQPHWSTLPAVRQNRVWVVDGNSYFNRPGPRLVDSLEILAQIIHPQPFAGLAKQGFQHWATAGMA
ncbi:ABC transporter substrate-binding protein [Candidatus Cyanaurora vandensis]|uniref:ABC transporter substrate-binding protein n=1 Tax=Candidatus Cyanaurora vandensis TaxID=2714958 RepID=UPI00257E82E9|nr:ABC transporter substrate-binding protein [Candidatus Cyanaurora vandensis]